MSWSIEEHIGEGRPWPEQVVVYRGETDESLTYARRSLSDVNQMVELMDTLAADNAKLRELCADMWHVMWACAEQRCKHRENECYVVNGNNGALPSHDECWYERRMRELGVDE